MQEEEERLPERDENGVDLTLIRWMLSLTPAERLRTAQQWANFVLKMRVLNASHGLREDPAHAREA